MNKFDRVISTLVLLQTKKVIKAKAISDRYGISLRTVYRDISTLKSAGIPIIGDPGIGYSILDGFQLPPIMFNDGEAAALLTAEKFIGQMTDKQTQSYYSDAMVKIKAILRSSEKHALEILDDSISFSSGRKWDNNNYLQDLFKSIASKLILHIQYKKADGSTSERRLESIGCYHHLNNWYLVAYCQLKEAYRTFKVNRIVNLQVLGQTFVTEHITLQKYIDTQEDSWKEDHKFHTIKVAFNQTFLKYAENRKHYFGFIEQEEIDNKVIITFLYSSLEVFSRWLLQFGDQATVIGPEELKTQLRELTEQLYKHYH